ncbi:MAG: GNAT family N-acetyltransferase [Anaerolineales bacterium]|jgi:amino-acid N-acetyltransferase
MDFTLRPAAKQDTPAIYDLVIEGRINPTGIEWERFTLAVTPDGEVIGCGQLKPHSDGSLELASIAVTSAWQGKGVARAIIEYLIAEVDTPLYLMCVSDMGPLYRKFGFRTLAEDEMPKYFRRVSRMAAFIEPLHREGKKLLVMGGDC